MDWQIIQQVGVPIALVIYFVMAGEKREKRMSRRLDEIQSAQVHSYETIIRENTAALRESSEAKRECAVAIRESAAAMREMAASGDRTTEIVKACAIRSRAESLAHG